MKGIIDKVAGKIIDEEAIMKGVSEIVAQLTDRLTAKVDEFDGIDIKITFRKKERSRECMPTEEPY